MTSFRSPSKALGMSSERMSDFVDHILEASDEDLLSQQNFEEIVELDKEFRLLEEHFSLVQRRLGTLQKLANPLLVSKASKKNV